MQGWWSVAKQSLGSPLTSQFTLNDLVQQILSFHQVFTKQNIKYPAVVTGFFTVLPPQQTLSRPAVVQRGIQENTGSTAAKHYDDKPL